MTSRHVFQSLHFQKITSACEGCTMQWPRLAPAGQARRGSSATLWAGVKDAMRQERSENLADLVIRQHLGKINTYQTYQRISQLVVGESALIPHPQDMQMLCQSVSFPQALIASADCKVILEFLFIPSLLVLPLLPVILRVAPRNASIQAWHQIYLPVSRFAASRTCHASTALKNDDS